MATDLYVLYQTDRTTSAKQRRKQYWFTAEEGCHLSEQEVKVVIGEGDVYVNLVTAITTCHLCKSVSHLEVVDPKCILCAERKEFYHRLAEKRVRHSLKMGYQRVHGPFNIPGTAPAPFPNLDTSPGEVIAEIMADLAADLDMAEQLLDRLKNDVVGTYCKMIGIQQMILVRKFGMNIFKLQQGFRPGEILDIARSGSKDQARLKRGQNRLREIKIDIIVYRKVWSQMKRMTGRR